MGAEEVNSELGIIIAGGFCYLQRGVFELGHPFEALPTFLSIHTETVFVGAGQIFIEGYKLTWAGHGGNPKAWNRTSFCNKSHRAFSQKPNLRS